MNTNAYADQDDAPPTPRCSPEGRELIEAAIELYRAAVEARRKGCSKSGDTAGMQHCTLIICNEPSVEDVLRHSYERSRTGGAS